MIIRKLLLILLLFFPVHGAWAEKIYLSCLVNKSYNPVTNKEVSEPDPMEKVFIIDTEKKTLSDGWVINISDKIFEWTAPKKSQGKHYLESVVIDRYTRNYRAEISYPMTKKEKSFYMENNKKPDKFRIAFYGSCKKTSDKKKF